MINWSTYTKHTLPFNCNNTTQFKTKARKASIEEGKGAKVRQARIDDKIGPVALDAQQGSSVNKAVFTKEVIFYTKDVISKIISTEELYYEH